MKWHAACLETRPDGSIRHLIGWVIADNAEQALKACEATFPERRQEGCTYTQFEVLRRLTG